MHATAKEIDMEAEFGLLASYGNSESSSVNGRFYASKDAEQWRQQLTVSAAAASAVDPNVVDGEPITSAERYSLQGQLDRKFDSENSLYVKVGYERDRFTGFDYEGVFTVGYGRQLIKNDVNALRLEVGPGMRFTKPENGPSDEEGLISSALRYQRTLSKTSKFVQSLEVDAGENRVLSTAVSALTAQVNQKLAMKLSLLFKHNSDPIFDDELQVERKSVDTEMAVSLVYSF